MQTPPPPPPRAERLERLSGTRAAPLDALVVGGGITGAGVALDLAARGLSVALVEQHDFAGHTSSASSRLIHGGLRYLEQFAFGLVRESCLERAWLLRHAAGLVWPEEFAFPLEAGGRVGRLRLAAGLGLYTLLSLPRPLGLPRLIGRRNLERRLPGLKRAPARAAIGAGLYLDGATDDSRLCLAVVRSAEQLGALCLSRVRFEGLERSSDGLRAHLVDLLEPGRGLEVEARRLVLCGGPFSDGLRAQAGLAGRWIAATRGIHVVLERDRFPTQGAFIFTSKLDGRAMFVIPWANRTILGTTDVDAAPGSDVAASAAEVDYLLESANQLCPGAALGRSDVVSTWAGLRPLLHADGSPSARSREERLEVDGPIYTLAGGKLTAFRAMAEPLGARLARDLGRGDPSRRSPTRGLSLWGALDRQVDLPAWSRWPGLDGQPPVEEQLWGWALERRYARLAPLVRQRAASSQALDAETRAAEIDWAVEQEHCLSAEDFLVRRTDLGYAPLAELDRCLPQVFARLSAALGWGPAELAREHEAVGALLERLHGWRNGRGPGA